MTEWQRGVAVINEASTPIGKMLIEYLVNGGLKVIGMSSNKEILADLRTKFWTGRRGTFHAYYIDITNEDEVNEAFERIQLRHGKMAIFINCVQATTISNLSPTTTSWRQLFDSKLDRLWLTNLKATDVMRKNNRNGHIFDISCMEPDLLMYTSANSELENKANLRITAVTRTIAKNLRQNAKQPDVLYTTSLWIETITPGAAIDYRQYGMDSEECKNMVSLFEINSIKKLPMCMKVLLVNDVTEGMVVKYLGIREYQIMNSLRGSASSSPLPSPSPER